jgi:hypothetical protein
MAGRRPQVVNLMKEMLKYKVFHLKVGDVDIEMSQYAFVPKQELPPPMPNAPQAPEPQMADAFEAFRWKRPVEQSVAPLPQDPTDPNGEIDDRALFGSDLPQAN